MTTVDDLKAARKLIERPENWCKGDGHPVVRFNDDPATTHADVLALFDRAIASLATPSVLP